MSSEFDVLVYLDVEHNAQCSNRGRSFGQAVPFDEDAPLDGILDGHAGRTNVGRCPRHAANARSRAVKLRMRRRSGRRRRRGRFDSMGNMLRREMSELNRTPSERPDTRGDMTARDHTLTILER
jgi:hypothetical protein